MVFKKVLAALPAIALAIDDYGSGNECYHGQSVRCVPKGEPIFCDDILYPMDGPDMGIGSGDGPDDCDYVCACDNPGDLIYYDYYMQDEVCVPADECVPEVPECENGKVWDECASGPECWYHCDSMFPDKCDHFGHTACEAKCVCQWPLLENDDGECVHHEECLPQCEGGMEYTECMQEQCSCDDYLNGQECGYYYSHYWCDAGCACPQGTYELDGQCVSHGQCMDSVQCVTGMHAEFVCGNNDKITCEDFLEGDNHHYGSYGNYGGNYGYYCSVECVCDNIDGQKAYLKDGECVPEENCYPECPMGQSATKVCWETNYTCRDYWQSWGWSSCYYNDVEWGCTCDDIDGEEAYMDDSGECVTVSTCMDDLEEEYYGGYDYPPYGDEEYEYDWSYWG